MNYHRVNAGCALFESAYHGGRPIVIVVGGTSKGGDYKPLKKTEILDYTVTDEWSECKSFLLKKIIFSLQAKICQDKLSAKKIGKASKELKKKDQGGWPGFPQNVVHYGVMGTFFF